ncbi:MAG: hypothetical protein PHW34_07310 [Hespellia sp.]|nr:hypothetical protein [Hespellia sp.]
MTKIYIAFVSTPGIFAGIIRKVLKQKYIHVALSMDETLEECYSVGRRNPEIPFLAGFEKEDKNRILKKYPMAEYKVCEITCTPKQKEAIRERLRQAMQNRRYYHYTILGLPLILLQIPFRQKNYYTCSSYIAEVLQVCGVWEWEKHTSIVTPKDFLIHEGKETVFEGRLEEITDGRAEKPRKVQYIYG